MAALAFPAVAGAHLQDGGGSNYACSAGVLYVHTSVGWVPIGYC